MTRKQYLKHKEVMDWFYNQPEGATVLYKTNNSITRLWNKSSYPSWYEDYIYVINDNYSEFRKAMIDGETIQWEQTENNWIDLPKDYDFIKAEENGATIEEYRIKPKEPKFKVGDLVRNVNLNLISKVEKIYHNGSLDMRKYIWVPDEDKLELWEPKEGEWCWVSGGDYTIPRLAKLIGIDNNGKRIFEYENDNGVTRGGWDNCEPFIDELPSILKYKDK